MGEGLIHVLMNKCLTFYDVNAINFLYVEFTPYKFLCKMSLTETLAIIFFIFRVGFVNISDLILQFTGNRNPAYDFLSLVRLKSLLKKVLKK